MDHPSVASLPPSPPREAHSTYHVQRGIPLPLQPTRRDTIGDNRNFGSLAGSHPAAGSRPAATSLQQAPEIPFSAPLSRVLVPPPYLPPREFLVAPPLASPAGQDIRGREVRRKSVETIKNIRSRSQGRPAYDSLGPTSIETVFTGAEVKSFGAGNGNQDNTAGSGEEAGETGKKMRRITSLFGLNKSARDSGEDVSRVQGDGSRAFSPLETRDGPIQPSFGLPNLTIKPGAASPGIRLVSVSSPLSSPNSLSLAQTPLSISSYSALYTSHNTQNSTPLPSQLDGQKDQESRVSPQPTPRFRLFGNKKKESDDSEAPKAWLLEWGGGEKLIGYDTTPLENGDKVPDLWNPHGDTLVYLYPRPLSTPGILADEPKPSFRINSSPLLLSCLSNFIHHSTEWSDRPLSPEEDITYQRVRGPNDLFIDQDMANGVQKYGIAVRESGPRTETAVVDWINSSAEYPRTVSSSHSKVQEAPIKYEVYYQAKTAATTRPAPSVEIIEAQKKKRLLDSRNLFAFLDGKPLVGSDGRTDAFQILGKVHRHLFIDPPKSTYQGEPALSAPTDIIGQKGKLQKSVSPKRNSAVAPSAPVVKTPEDNLSKNFLHAEPLLDHYITALHLDDVRELKESDSTSNNSKHNSIGLRDCMEAIYVGEKWCNTRLYIEGFIHAVGRWGKIKGTEEPIIKFLNPITLEKLDRAKLDLDKREKSILERIGGFGYPAMWSGVAKYPEFKPWRNGFVEAKKLLLSYLKHLYGSWPPKAGKKGKGGGYGGERGGLSRLVLKKLEEDVGDVWSAIVDWDTPRYPPGGYAENNVDAIGELDEERKKLRALMEEFDRAVPPVQPRPMFDMPKLPGFHLVSSTDTSEMKMSKKWKKDELVQLLEESYNSSDSNTGALLVNFKQMELQHAQHCKTIEELAEARKGRWMFIYAVLQSLPMVTVDAPAARWTEEIEYYLCESYKGSLPWDVGANANNRGRTTSRVASMIWTSAMDPVQMGTGLNNSSSLSLTGVQEDDEVYAIYARSYCWLRAAEWCAEWERKQTEEKQLEQQRLSVDRQRAWEMELQSGMRDDHVQTSLTYEAAQQQRRDDHIRNSLIYEAAQQQRRDDHIRNSLIYEAAQQQRRDDHIRNSLTYEAVQQQRRDDPVRTSLAYEAAQQQRRDDPVRTSLAYEAVQQQRRDDPVRTSLAYEAAQQHDPVRTSLAYEAVQQQRRDDPVRTSLAYEAVQQRRDDPVRTSLAYEAVQQQRRDDPVRTSLTYEAAQQQRQDAVEPQVRDWRPNSMSPSFGVGGNVIGGPQPSHPPHTLAYATLHNAGWQQQFPRKPPSPRFAPLDMDQPSSRTQRLSPEEIFPESLLPSTAAKRMSLYGYNNLTGYGAGTGYRSFSGSLLNLSQGRNSPPAPGTRSVSMSSGFQATVIGSAIPMGYQGAQGSGFIPYRSGNTSPAGSGSRVGTPIRGMATPPVSRSPPPTGYGNINFGDSSLSLSELAQGDGVDDSKEEGNSVQAGDEESSLVPYPRGLEEDNSQTLVTPWKRPSITRKPVPLSGLGPEKEGSDNLIDLVGLDL